MKVPEWVRDCVVFVGYRKDDGEHFWLGATAFLVVMPSDTNRVFAHYAVTAKHVLEHINSLDKEIVLQVNCKSGTLRQFTTIYSDWVSLPNSPNDDVAVLPINPKVDPSVDDELDHLFINTESFVGTKKLPESVAEIGSSIVVTGLFTRMTRTSRNFPIVRTGYIAAAPDEPIDISVDGKRFSFKAYLVEARSIGGLSGSPVFLQTEVASLQSGYTSIYGPQMHTANGPTQQNPVVRPTTNMYVQHALLGIMFGHFDAKLTNDQTWTQESMNLGISIVIPAAKILEVLNLSRLAEVLKGRGDKSKELK